MQENWVQSLCQKDPLKKEIGTDSSILAWEISWMEEPDELQPIGLQRVEHDLTTKPPKGKNVIMKSRYREVVKNRDSNQVTPLLTNTVT